MKHPILFIVSLLLILLGSLFPLISSAYLVLGLCLIFGGLFLLLLRVLLSDHKRIAVILTALCVFFVLIFEYPVIKDSFGTMDNTTFCDYLIICGAGIDKDRPSPALSDRLRRAADYLSQNKNALVICSGGQGPGEDISEAECMRRYLIDAGIEKDRILLEDLSSTTRENLINSLALIKNEAAFSDPTIGVCSSEYHLHRIGYLFEKLTGKRPLLLSAKTTDLLSKINYFLYEIPAGIKAYIQMN